jgi:thiol-disulfide isomerase/thioredoxin
LFASQATKEFGTYKAKEIRKSDIWINSKPLTLKSLKGKVVFLDFWAFDCDPCIETMPHVVELYDKYSKEGVVFIGVHTPRIDIEHDVTDAHLKAACMQRHLRNAGRECTWAEEESAFHCLPAYFFFPFRLGPWVKIGIPRDQAVFLNVLLK